MTHSGEFEIVTFFALLSGEVIGGVEMWSWLEVFQPFQLRRFAVFGLSGNSVCPQCHSVHKGVETISKHSFKASIDGIEGIPMQEPVG